jgi:hypothetical protein
VKVGDLVKVKAFQAAAAGLGVDIIGVVIQVSLNGALRVLFQNATTEYLWQYQVELVSESR